MSVTEAGGVVSPLRAVVEVVVRALVDHPDAVKVTETERRGMTVVELKTGPGDMGKIIGRQGRTAAALRTLVAVTAEKHGRRAQPVLLEDRAQRLLDPDARVDDEALLPRGRCHDVAVGPEGGGGDGDGEHGWERSRSGPAYTGRRSRSRRRSPG